MGRRAKTTEFAPADLRRWRLVEDFRARLAQAAASAPLASTWTDSQRLLHHADYLSLFLFGLLNPVVKTLRGLCAASQLERVQQEVCTRPVSLGSFSEAQHLIDPTLLAEVFAQLSGQLRAPATGEAARRWLIQDGSLFEALPRMYWTFWRRQATAQAQVRLHLSLDLESGAPARAAVTPGKTCERAVWRTLVRPGDAYVADRYFGEDYRLFGELSAAHVAFVVRLRDQAVITVEEELPSGAADRAAGVMRSAWARLGCNACYHSQRLRVVWVQTPREVLPLVTNLGPEELTAGEVALLYKERWRIELFFRWVKCILGCRHWLAESPRGVTVEIYLALIAALMLQLYTGSAPNRRLMEMIRWYLTGVASLEELSAAVERERRKAAHKKT